METKTINFYKLLKQKLKNKKQRVAQKSKNQEMLELHLPRKLTKLRIKFKSHK